MRQGAGERPPAASKEGARPDPASLGQLAPDARPWPRTDRRPAARSVLRASPKRRGRPDPASLGRLAPDARPRPRLTPRPASGFVLRAGQKRRARPDPGGLAQHSPGAHRDTCHGPTPCQTRRTSGEPDVRRSSQPNRTAGPRLHRSPPASRPPGNARQPPHLRHGAKSTGGRLKEPSRRPLSRLLPAKLQAGAYRTT